MDKYEDRKFVLTAIFITIGLLYIFRLFYIQVIDDTYKTSANNQALRHVTDYPNRGKIFDRNGELLVYNEAAYNLKVIPRKVKDLDTLTFCKLLRIDTAEFSVRMKKARGYSRYKASIFIEQITADEYASISEQLYKFKGFSIEKRTLRKYPHHSAAHVLGYISEISNGQLAKDNYYRKGDYVGKTGLERTYESRLRGTRGKKIYNVDVHNRIQGSYQDGVHDTLSVPGVDLTTTLDIDLQNYGEKLMANKRGSIVAIDPKTGEILSLISTPNYDPNILVGRARGDNYSALAANDSLDPLFNRALMAKYPPGSIYKMVQALIGLEEGVIDANTGFPCKKSLVGCHNHPHPDRLSKAIQFSCNPYFYRAFQRIINQNKSTSTFKDSEIGLRNWRNHMLTFGFGQRLPIDFPIAKSGSIPSVALYDKFYGSGRWKFSTIYSISIGQGEVEVIPLQMANLAAIIANKGYYIPPHLVRSIGDETADSVFVTPRQTSVDSSHYQIVIDAMQEVIEAPHGTARRARVPGIEICGKTGTAQNPHGEDHSVFIAFAPKDNPTIAVATYVENAGGGGLWAAPISSLMIEKYLNDSIARPETEKRILENSFLEIEK